MMDFKNNFLSFLTSYWWLLLLGGYFLYTYLSQVERNNTGDVITSGYIESVLDWEVGDCYVSENLNVKEQSETGGEYFVPCEQPHTHQVYKINHSLFSTFSTYPGQEIIIEEANKFCLEGTDDLVLNSNYQELLISLIDEGLSFEYVFPLEYSWPEYKGVICMFSFPEEIKGSVL